MSKTLYKTLLGCITLLAFVFLYVPIVHITLASFSKDIVWPYPIRFTTAAYAKLFEGTIYPLWTDEDGTGRFEWRAPMR